MPERQEAVRVSDARRTQKIRGYGESQKLLKGKDGAALVLKDGTVLNFDEMLILFETPAIMVIAPLIALIIKLKNGPIPSSSIPLIAKFRSNKRKDKVFFQKLLTATVDDLNP